jgi:hypothetical protein
MPVATYAYGAQKWGGTGTPSGGFTNGPGNAALYDSITHKVAALCGGTPGPSPILSAFSTKTWAAPDITGRVRVFAPSDAPFANLPGAFTARFQIDQAGAIVDLCAPFNFTNNVVGRIFEMQATLQVPASDVRLLLESANPAFMNIAQVQFFSADWNGFGPGAPDANGDFWFVPDTGVFQYDVLAIGGGGGGARGGGGGGGVGKGRRGCTPGEPIRIRPGRGGLRGAVSDAQDGTDTVVDETCVAGGGKSGQIGGNSGGGGAAHGFNVWNGFGRVGGVANLAELIGGFGGGTFLSSGAEAGIDDPGEPGTPDGGGGAGGWPEGGSGGNGSIRIATKEMLGAL